MWRYGCVTEEKKKSMGRYPWNLRPEKSKKPRVATHGLFDAFKEKQGIWKIKLSIIEEADQKFFLRHFLS